MASLRPCRQTLLHMFTVCFDKDRSRERQLRPPRIYFVLFDICRRIADFGKGSADPREYKRSVVSERLAGCLSWRTAVCQEWTADRGWLEEVYYARLGGKKYILLKIAQEISNKK